jgi:hypothetical protein
MRVGALWQEHTVLATLPGLCIGYVHFESGYKVKTCTDSIHR